MNVGYIHSKWGICKTSLAKQILYTYRCLCILSKIQRLFEKSVLSPIGSPNSIKTLMYKTEWVKALFGKQLNSTVEKVQNQNILWKSQFSAKSHREKNSHLRNHTNKRGRVQKRQNKFEKFLQKLKTFMILPRAIQKAIWKQSSINHCETDKQKSVRKIIALQSQFKRIVPDHQLQPNMCYTFPGQPKSHLLEQLRANFNAGPKQLLKAAVFPSLPMSSGFTPSDSLKHILYKDWWAEKRYCNTIEHQKHIT